MPTTYSNRVLTILFALWVSLSAIYPRVPGSLFWFFNITGPISFQHNLKPGIDMVGGTSLTYEIKQPEGSTADSKLAENVATALKRRVDPNGVRNLIWRPQGANRLEIQIPSSRQNEQAEVVRKSFVDAKDALEATNLRVVAVISDLENKTGAERDEALKRYAGDSKQRAQLLEEMKALSDEIKSAREARNLDASSQAINKLSGLEAKLSDTNLSVSTLESALELSADKRAPRIQAIKAKYPDYPSRQAAIDAFVKAHDEFMPLRDKIDDVARVKRDLRGSGVLSFHIVVETSSSDWESMRGRLKEEGPRARPGDTTRWYVVDRPDEPGIRDKVVEYNSKYYVLLSTEPGNSLMNAEGRLPWGLASASKGTEDGQRIVQFRFDSAGANLFGDLTTRYRPTADHRYQLAIVLDGKLYSAPSINSPIFGSGQISGGEGGFSESEQDYLVATLGAGALPAQLTDEPISEITVGPQLGADNLKAGLISCAAGLVIVFIFLVGYYYFAGFVAFVAVVLNLAFILGSMAIINATFTLPGVAGIVLSVAMAVDANVLIFERLREEQARGLSLKMALRNSYDRAFSAIFDGQVTTAISSVFLFWFGSEEVRGFGLTLLLGIITSLFTALFVTKTIFGLLVEYRGLRDLGSLPRTFPRWNELLTPKIDWIGWSWAFITFSVVFIGAGMACFFVKLNAGQALDIEFSGGTSVRVELVEPMTREALQELADAQSDQNPRMLATPRVVSVGTEGTQYEISTPTTVAKDVQQAVLSGLGDRLKIAKPSKFDLFDADYGTVFDRALFAIESPQTKIDGVGGYLLSNHVGGVAVVLNNIDPPLTRDEIRARLDQRLLQQDAATRPERVEVEMLDGNRKAVVLFSDSRYVYNSGDANAMSQWQASLASPVWSVVHDAINNPPQLKGVTSFNAQVADEAKINTVVAMSLSVLGIMAYIWVRFGNFKFGGATVVACIHDALFVVAAIGFSYYLGQIGFFEDYLLIRPFRIDLTLVAAILTVVGYSMNDTVVVFDRIRENRGKFGVLSRQVINDSINQTFSRTLLTGGTSIGILLVMYAIGGDGIHAFTFALLLGIIVGTYSSIAVASPLLLLGSTESESVALAKPVRSQAAAG